MRWRHRRGQTMLEYVITLLALMGALATFAYLLRTTRHAVVRTESLVRTDYP